MSLLVLVLEHDIICAFLAPNQSCGLRSYTSLGNFGLQFTPYRQTRSTWTHAGAVYFSLCFLSTVSTLDSSPFHFLVPSGSTCRNVFHHHDQGRISRCTSRFLKWWRLSQPISARFRCQQLRLDVVRLGRQPLIAKSHSTTYDWKSRIFPEFQAESDRDSRADMDRNVRYEMVSVKIK